MSYSINHNLMADNVARNLGTHYSRLSSSVRRLSSGLRINSAADDASGLAIRELMRADISALHQGARNANDAISMVQVADGALAIIDEKLIRMKELAEQAATGTYSSTQRLMLESEYQAMASEISRIANATDFNGIKLLDGSLKGAHDGSGLVSTGQMKIHFGAGNDSAEDYYYIQIGDCAAGALGVGNTADRPYYDYIKNETIVTEQMTFSPAPSYPKYINPDNGRVYYSDGDYFFTDPADPANTALDWTTDREIIDKLRTQQITQPTRVSYASFRHPDGQVYYTRDGGKTYTTDPNDPDAKMLLRNNYEDRKIMAELVSMNRTMTVETQWMVYENEGGAPYYSCDNGRTFFPGLNEPLSAEGMLDWNNPDDKDTIIALRPKLEAATVLGPTKEYNYVETMFLPPNTGNIYYKVEDPDNPGTYFYTQNSANPEIGRIEPADPGALRVLPQTESRGMTVLELRDPDGNIYYQNKGPNAVAGIPPDGYFRYQGGAIVQETDTAVTNNLKPIPETTPLKKSYVLYTHQDTGRVYYFDEKNNKFYSSTTGSPASEVKDQAVINRLEAVPVRENGQIVYNTWQDSTDNNKKYYTRGDGVFFSDKDDPEGSRLTDAELQALRNKGAGFAEIDLKIRYDTSYAKYKDKNSDTFYYSCDGGKTFATKGADGSWPAAPGIGRGDVDPVHQRSQEYIVANYQTYTDPDGKTVYYGPATGYFYNLDDPAGSGFTGDKDDLTPVSNPAVHNFGSYYAFTDEAGNRFYSKIPNVQDRLNDNPPPALLDAAFNPVAQTPAKLTPVPYAPFKKDVPQDYPDHFLIFVDPENDIKYYQDPASGKFIKYPGNPYKPDSFETDQDVIDRLKPYATTVKKEWHTKSLHPSAYTISTQEAAQSALEAINMAIESKDNIRAHLGAMQNRLENTITNLNVQAENLQAAESRVSDVDVATEMTEFVRNQILSQASTAMLGQANSLPNMMMSLISG